MNGARLKKVVVTGGLGFIGSALCRRLLDDGCQVMVVDIHLFGRRLQVLPKHQNLVVKKIDIRDRVKLVREIKAFNPDSLFHLAAIAFIPACTQDPGLAVSVHLDGTINVLHAARLARVRNLYFASSADVYSPEQVILSEKSTPLLPPSDVYGPTKLAGELFFRQFQEETGAHVVITRAFNIYGPGRTNPFLIPSVCEQLMSGAKELKLGNLNAARDYVHVDDCIEAMIRLMVGTNGLVIANIGSGRRTTVRQVVSLCEKILKRKIQIASSAEYRRSKATDRSAWQADIGLIRKIVAWSPKISLEQGLRRMLIEISS